MTENVMITLIVSIAVGLPLLVVAFGHAIAQVGASSSFDELARADTYRQRYAGDASRWETTTVTVTPVQPKPEPTPTDEEKKDERSSTPKVRNGRGRR